MIIGIPKEIMHEENRVSATPETVSEYVKTGIRVLVETGAGNGAFYSDDDYIAAGAQTVDDAEKIYSESDLILKVKEPLFNEQKGKHEVDMMHKGQYLITFLHPASPANHQMVQKMAEKGVISLTLDGVPRIKKARPMDALASMSVCAGYKGMIMAVDRIPGFMPGITSASCDISPAKVLVIGVGVAGRRALTTAKSLGAATFGADINPLAQENILACGAECIDISVSTELSVGTGGKVLRLPDEVLEEKRKILSRILPDMDIVFCSALIPGKVAPILITEEMVRAMKPGSVLVDISIDQGGNCEITPKGTIEVKHGVTLIGTKNIPGLLPESSTRMFARNVLELVKYIVRDGEIVLDEEDEIISSVLTTAGGRIVHTGALEAMGLL